MGRQKTGRPRAHPAGFDGHLVKPVDLAALARLLGRSKWVPGVSPPGTDKTPSERLQVLHEIRLLLLGELQLSSSL